MQGLIRQLFWNFVFLKNILMSREYCIFNVTNSTNQSKICLIGIKYQTVIIITNYEELNSTKLKNLFSKRLRLNWLQFDKLHTKNCGFQRNIMKLELRRCKPSNDFFRKHPQTIPSNYSRIIIAFISEIMESIS